MTRTWERVLPALVLALPLLAATTSPVVLLEVAALSLVVLAAAWASRPLPVTTLPRVRGTGVDAPHPPVLRTRATDPVHHPLAPRAPGVA